MERIDFERSSLRRTVDVGISLLPVDVIELDLASAAAVLA